MKYKYKIIISLIVFLFILTGGILFHYGLWSMAQKNDYLAMKTSGCINIIYSDNDNILMVNPKNLSDDDGLSYIPYTITLTNSCDSIKSLSVYLDVYDDSTISDNKIKVNINGDSSLNTSLLTDNTKIKGQLNILNTYRLLKLDLNEYETKRINLRLWLDENEVISQDKNRFHAKYYIIANDEKNIKNFYETILSNNEIKENDGLIQVGSRYYFNGNVSNNYVKIDDKVYRILGINEDKSIKLIYDNNDLEGIYNDIYKNEENVDYTSSKMKEYLDKYYDENLKKYDKIIKEEDYCNDTTNEEGWRIVYNSYIRNFQNYQPSLDCNDTTKSYGGKVKSKIGLITLDEAAIAGYSSTNSNDGIYLNNGKNFYTMTPTMYNYRAIVGIVKSDGRLDDVIVNEVHTIRPVINIDDSIVVTGLGTMENPYLIS